MCIMEKTVVLTTLVAKETDALDYTTYVFEVDKEDPFYTTSKYVMCVRYPNWQTSTITLGSIGYLEFIEVIAGKDKYWNGNEFVAYNYSTWQFINFIKKPTITSPDKIIVD